MLNKSGNSFKDEQSKNKLFIYFTLQVFQLEISDNSIQDEQSRNILFISYTLLVFHF